MYFDKTQNGFLLGAWVKEAERLGLLPDAESLWSDEAFDKIDPLISYPLVGFLTEKMIELVGKTAYLAFYRMSETGAAMAFQEAFSAPFSEFYSRARRAVGVTNYDPHDIMHISQMLTAANVSATPRVRGAKL